MFSHYTNFGTTDHSLFEFILHTHPPTQLSLKRRSLAVLLSASECVCVCVCVL